MEFWSKKAIFEGLKVPILKKYANKGTCSDFLSGIPLFWQDLFLLILIPFYI